MKLADEIAALRPRVFKIARKFTKSAELADDITQNVMVRAMTAPYKEIDNLVGWLGRITYTEFVRNRDYEKRYQIMGSPILESFLPSQLPNQEDAAYCCEVLAFMKSHFTPLQYDAMIPGNGKPFEPNPQNVTTRRNRGREKLAQWLEAA